MTDWTAVAVFTTVFATVILLLRPKEKNAREITSSPFCSSCRSYHIRLFGTQEDSHVELRCQECGNVDQLPVLK